MDAKIDVKEMLEFVYSFYKTMREHQVVLVYEGEVTHQITKAFTSLTEARMELQMEDPSTQKKVFHVMVECLQNISKHAEVPGKNENHQGYGGEGVFLLSRCDDNYYITTGNAVEKTKANVVSTMLDTINQLDKDGLKDLYKQRIKDGRISSKGGAGLGFIDIAKKTGSQMNYLFLPLDDEYLYFILSILISRKN